MNISFYNSNSLLGYSYEDDIYKDINDKNQQILSNVHRCWLPMLLVAGFLPWVLACGTIKKKKNVNFEFLHFPRKLYFIMFLNVQAFNSSREYCWNCTFSMNVQIIKMPLSVALVKNWTVLYIAARTIWVFPMALLNLNPLLHGM